MYITEKICPGKSYNFHELSPKNNSDKNYLGYAIIFISVSSSEVCASRDHFFLSVDFHELWHSVPVS